MTDQTSAVPMGANPALPPPPAANGADPGVQPVADDADTGPPPVGPTRGKLAALLSDPDEREKLRFLVEETSKSLNDITDECHLAHGVLSKWMEPLGWTRRHPDAPKQSVRKDNGQRPVNRKRLAESMHDAEAVKSRLIRAVDRQIAKIDTRVRKKEAIVEEKDARTLGTLAKTLQTLIALDGDAGAKLHQPEPLDRDALRAALARRFSVWAEQGGRSG